MAKGSSRAAPRTAASRWDLTRHPEFAVFARTDADVERCRSTATAAGLLSVTAHGMLQSWTAAPALLLEECQLPIHRSR